MLRNLVCLGMAVVAVLAALLSAAVTTRASTFVVNSTADTGDANTLDGICDDGTGSCTLRAAIQQSNATVGADAVHFNVPGAAPHTIAPASPLPLVSESLTINGTTEPGFAGIPIIELRGDGAVPNASGLRLSAAGSVVKGLVINRFAAPGIWIDGGGNSVVAGNFIGIDTGGTVALGNHIGVRIDESPGNTIGGTAPGAGNVISDNGGWGIYIRGAAATGNLVQGNLIGTDRFSTAALGNNIGVEIDDLAGGNTIGGTGSGARNLISGNRSHGVNLTRVGSANLVQGNLIGTDAGGTADLGNAGSGIQCGIGAAGNIIGGTAAGARNIISGNDLDGITADWLGCDRWQIQGNYIGTDITGTGPLGNSRFGIWAATLKDSTIGGTAAGAGNIIAFNGEHGVCVCDLDRTAIRSNSIFSNGGLGIDLYPGGVNANDPGDADISGVGNAGQNYPVLASVSTDGVSTSISGTLNSKAGTAFALEFFVSRECDPSGYGEGETLMGSTNVVTDGSGNASFTVSFPGGDADGDGIPGSITSTATDPEGNTSEFSACIGDNCPTVPNPGQTNTDKTLAAGGASVSGDVLGDACDSDDDNDTWSDAAEGTIGTSPLDNCTGAPGSGGDAHPADFNRDKIFDITDIGEVAAVFGQMVTPDLVRRDIAPAVPDRSIDIVDIGAVAGLFGQVCQ